MQAWKDDYNTVRPHSNLGYLLPDVWAHKQLTSLA
ncbi:MAG: transposase [Armatimonadetes bacterium]|nr:transposase [Armatimonadota bacterium]